VAARAESFVHQSILVSTGQRFIDDNGSTPENRVLTAVDVIEQVQNVLAECRSALDRHFQLQLMGASVSVAFRRSPGGHLPESVPTFS